MADNKIPSPYININQENIGDGEKGRQSDDIGSTAPAWVVCFLQFEDPQSSVDTSKRMKIKDPLLIVVNDCIGVTINNSKSSYIKSASLTMKAGEIYYPNAAHCGDWVLIWMLDDQSKIPALMSEINASKHGKPKQIINGFNSGLKFIGRVTGVSSVDSTTANGIRSVTQSVECSAFTEFSSSIYFTFLAQSAFTSNGASPSNGLTMDRANVNASTVIKSVMPDKAGESFADKILSQFDGTSNSAGLSPDNIIEFLLQLVFGMAGNNINGRDADGKSLTGAAKGSFNNGIYAPSELGRILGKNESIYKYWQILDTYLGMQTYGVSKNASNNMAPIFSRSLGNIKHCSRPCKGSMIFRPPLWSNVEIWSILAQYINPIVNEMFTVLRANEQGYIVPTLVLRERPFGTGLYGYMSTTVEDKIVSRNDDRAMYYNHPRWIISPKVIRTLNVSTDESRRVNLVQIWITPSTAAFAGNGSSQVLNESTIRNDQFRQGNYVTDEDDIYRHGLRAEIQEFSNGVTMDQYNQASHYAKIRADHLFNGHLFYNASVTLNGIVKPICEGDNAEINGIVYHIESVSHSGQISGNGIKSFTTSLQLSHGILASSLKRPEQKPEYPAKGSPNALDHDGPGVVDVQQTPHTNRDADGELIKSAKSKGKV